MSNDIMKSSTSKKSFTKELKGTASEVIAQIKKLIREGNARRLIIENKGGKVLFQTQLTAGVAGTALITAMAPIVAAISMFALFMNDVKIIVEKYPEEDDGDTSDEYEVETEAEVIEIKDQEEEDESPQEEDKAKTDKTVGKKEDNE